MELAEAVAPLLRATGVGRVCKKKCDVDEAGCKDGLGAVDVLGAVDEHGKCAV